MKKAFAILFGTILIFAVVSAGQVGTPRKISASKTVGKPANIENADSKIPVIKPPNFVGELRRKMSDNPGTSARELAEYGNERLKTSGYDFTFDWEPRGAKNEAKLKDADFTKYRPFEYRFADRAGRRKLFHLMNDDFGHPCFSVIDLPATNVNQRTMTVIADGQPVELQRTKDFYAEEIVLVDRTLKKTLRKWTVLIDGSPLGISEDGRKIYFDTWEFTQDANDDFREKPLGVAVEISDNGDLRLVAASEIKSGDAVFTVNADKNGEGQYARYTVGKNEFIIRFDGACS